MHIDLHNHTTRCNHAEGTVDEYIQRAIELGIDIYGFSEHAPMDFDEHYRLKFEEMDAYVSDILGAKEKYKNDIDILLGYEVDWLQGHMDERVLHADVDYLIGSVHFIDKWSFDNPEFIGGWKERDTDEIWQAYFEATEAMAASGKFDIAGHFDLIRPTASSWSDRQLALLVAVPPSKTRLPGGDSLRLRSPKKFLPPK